MKLDPGAASVYIGVDECYQNSADHTGAPIVTAAEVEQLVADGILEKVVVEDGEEVTGNVGILAGQGDGDEVDPEKVDDPEKTEPKTPVLDF